MLTECDLLDLSSHHYLSRSKGGFAFEPEFPEIFRLGEESIDKIEATELDALKLGALEFYSLKLRPA
jgi:hypothetical protein